MIFSIIVKAAFLGVVLLLEQTAADVTPDHVRRRLPQTVMTVDELNNECGGETKYELFVGITDVHVHLYILAKPVGTDSGTSLVR